MISVNTPNINSLLALPYKKEPVQSSKEFLGQWTDMKEYIRKVGGRGASYQVNKAQRLSEEFSWPETQSVQPG